MLELLTRDSSLFLAQVGESMRLVIKLVLTMADEVDVTDL